MLMEIVLLYIIYLEDTLLPLSTPNEVWYNSESDQLSEPNMGHSELTTIHGHEWGPEPKCMNVFYYPLPCTVGPLRKGMFE